MAKLLLIDTDGKRRAGLEARARQAGHQTFNAVTAAEAERLAAIYVPEAVLLASDPPDATAQETVKRLRALRQQLRDAPLVVPNRALAPADDPQVVVARSLSASDMLAAAEGALGERL